MPRAAPSGVFADVTSTQLPATVLDASRDVDFADVDNDGDPDLFISNTSQISNQGNRWWINMGGAAGRHRRASSRTRPRPAG